MYLQKKLIHYHYRGFDANSYESRIQFRYFALPVSILYEKYFFNLIAKLKLFIVSLRNQFIFKWVIFFSIREKSFI